MDSDYESETEDKDIEEVEEEEVGDDLLEQPEQTRKRVLIPPYKFRTSDDLTKYEAVRLVSIRATHIDQGSPVYVEIKPGDSTIDIAVRELMEKRMPLYIERKISNVGGFRYVELRNPNRMNCTKEWFEK
jgi:DNA-directed RNA polymerase I, II, and III subunit RPABC2